MSSKYHQGRTSHSSGGGDDKMQDPSAGALFNVNYKKHEDLKNMLDQNKDSLKLEAMKRIIGMIARGKNASMLFPAVVKNVACKNIEVKKLVYVYLERYAEEQQDLALLSISTFQRGLKDSNQMIRASALRVLSSIRVSIIVPIMLLAIKEGVNDMCPFVRKTAAHAIPKLYSLDPGQKENLIEIIDKMLGDRTTLVAGSVVMAFEEVCPDRIDLIHRHFRKLCSLLVDVDEWGQIAIISMLTRYARTQFLNPNENDDDDVEEEKPFYEEEDDDDEASDDDDADEKQQKYVMDADHRMLLKSTRSLLQSRNAAVVMAVAQLYYHVAPKCEFHTVVKGLIRLLRGRREVQAIVLHNIASISLKRKNVFGPYLKSFYVRSTDPTHVRILKLEVLTNLATESNIAVILREFQTYVKSSDKKFVAHTIQAIARCATNITEVTDTCLSGLVTLLSNRDESVVAESVVVIKKLLQMDPAQHSDIIKDMAKLIDTIQVPMARASIFWLIGEYCEIVPKIAPDVLRKAAKHFIQQEDIVKLQIINLAAKLYLTNSKQTKLMTQYVLQLAKYDQNYDIRDRSRFIKHLIMPDATGGDNSFRKYAKKILLASKPAPVLESHFKGRDKYQLGSLSHAINAEVTGYQPLPDFPLEKPDPTTRNVPVVSSKVNEDAPGYRHGKKKVSQKKKAKSFYSDEEDEEKEEDDDEEDEDEDSSEEESSSSEEDSDDSDSSESTEGPDSRISESDVGVTSPKLQPNQRQQNDDDEGCTEEESSSEEEESSSSGEEDSDDDEEEESEEESEAETTTKKQVNLLDLDDFVMGGATATVQPPQTTFNLLTPDLVGLSFGAAGGDGGIAPPAGGGDHEQESFELLHRVTGEGLQVKYKFSRKVFQANNKMTSIDLEFINHAKNPIREICIGDKKLVGGIQVHEFEEIELVEPDCTVVRTLGVDFIDSTQMLEFELRTKTRKFNVSIRPPIGELVQPWTLPQTEFLKYKATLSGMNENKAKLKLKNDGSENLMKMIADQVYQVANLCRVPSTQDNIHRFAGKTSHSESAVLVTVEVVNSLDDNDEAVHLSVNCDKMVVCSMIFKLLKDRLSK